MYCTNCGSPVPDDAKFCPNCGMPIMTEKEERDHASVADATPEENAPEAEPGSAPAEAIETTAPAETIETTAPTETIETTAPAEPKTPEPAGDRSAASTETPEWHNPVSGQTGDNLTEAFIRHRNETQNMHFENGVHKDAGTSTNEADTANTNTFSGSDATNANNLAIASMVCGILSIVCWFLGHYSWLALPFGIAGLILAFDAKKKGNDSVYRTAGFITSLVGMLFGVILFIACVGCVGCLGMLAVMNGH